MAWFSRRRPKTAAPSTATMTARKAPEPARIRRNAGADGHFRAANRKFARDTNGQALTAAAQVVTGKQLRTIVGKWSWQKSAYDYYDSCGELHFAINYLALAGSRAKLYVGEPDENGAAEPTPSDDEDAKSLLRELGDDFTAHAELIRKMFIHLLVGGETFVIGYDDPARNGERRWTAVSQDQLKISGEKIFLRTSPTTQIELRDDDSLIVRVHFQDARYDWAPESHIRALLGDLARLQALSSHTLATTDSRLAGAGILLIGDSVSPPPGNPGDEVQHSDPFVDNLINSMVVPINDRNSASAVVPFVVRVPDEALDKIKHITFSTPFDEQVPKLTDMTLKKIAIGLSMPPEILLGIGDTNHWSAWAIDENVVKLSIAPVLGVICQALTCNYMRPAYEADQKKPCNAVIWFDTTELTQRPDKSEDALTLNARGLISDATTRRACGFSEDDAPTDAERLKSILWDLATNPATAALILPTLGVNLPELASGRLTRTPAVISEPDGTADDSGAEDAELADPPPVDKTRSIPDRPSRNTPPATPALPAGRGGGS